MNILKNNPKQKTAVEQELDLELLTKKYILGEINLEEYKKEVSRLETRLDLRRVASKLKPILIPLEQPKQNHHF
jgi:predicted  nucleic acid-binding Zn-ribbon protein